MGPRRFLRQLVGVAAKIGEANDLIALVMMPKDHRPRAELAPCRGYARIHGVVREYEIVVERATDAPLFLRSNRNRHIFPPSVPQLQLLGTEMLKASTGSSGSTALFPRPIRGVVEARSLTSIDDFQGREDARKCALVKHLKSLSLLCHCGAQKGKWRSGWQERHQVKIAQSALLLSFSFGRGLGCRLCRCFGRLSFELNQNYVECLVPCAFRQMDRCRSKHRVAGFHCALLGLAVGVAKLHFAVRKEHGHQVGMGMHHRFLARSIMRFYDP